MQLAAINGCAETIELLVKKGGANVQQRNASTGWVALHEAAYRGYTSCVKVLLRLNAPLRPRTLEGETPKDLAVKQHQNEVAELLGRCLALSLHLCLSSCIARVCALVWLWD